jgi:HlyD family secretion protein
LLKADAATRKQLDDINALIDQLQNQISVTRQKLKVNNYNTAIQNNNILSEKEPLEKTAAQFQEQINKGRILNPINGTVLTKYALTGEMAVAGKPLYKLLIQIHWLKAYMTGDQLSQVKSGTRLK